MKNYKFFAIYIVLLTALFFSFCDTHGSSQTSTYKSFAYELRGMWESNNSGSYYNGTLKIDSDSITIGNYAETQKPTDGAANELPFRDIPKDRPLKGYSQDNKIYIEFPTGVQKEYTYSLTDSGNYPNNKLLSFDFGGRTETLKRTGDY